MIKIPRIRSKKSLLLLSTPLRMLRSWSSIFGLPPYPQDAPLKYSLFFRNHPANYKYFSIYRELQRRKKPTSKSNLITNNTRFKSSNVQSNHPPNDTLSNQRLALDQPKTDTYITLNQSHDHALSSNSV